MNAGTGELEALRAEVARLAALVDSFAQRTIAVEAIWDAGRESVLAASRRPPRPGRGRPAHLRAVDGKSGGPA